MTRTAYHHGNLREVALTEALRILDDEGLANLGLRRVARAAKVSHTALGREFGNSNGLLAAMMARVLVELDETQAKQVGDSTGLPAFRALGVGYITYGIAYPARIQLLSHPNLLEVLGDDEGLRQAYTSPRDRLLAAARACQAEGSVRKVPEQRIAMLVWSAVHGFASLVSMDPSLFDPSMVDAFFEDLYLGVGDPAAR
ncbi:MAG: TetR/AcrR family transcriptional regulator [Myxococcota bacterium]